MTFEGPNKIESTNNQENFEHKKLRIYNEIQMQIMGLMCSPDDGADCLTKWVGDYGPSFSMIFKEVLSKDGEFLDKWDNNIDSEKDKSLDFFMEELRKLDGPSRDIAA
ncbi:MAG: hypothetical protein ACYCY6_02825 [Minisyncoccota bacterium]